MKFSKSILSPNWLYLAVFLFSKSAAVAQIAPADDCVNAPFFGESMMNALSSQTYNYTPSNITSFCGSIEVDQWIRVRADSSSSTVTLFPSNCTNGDGVQLALYEECGGPFIACNVGCQGCGTIPQSIGTNLAPGKVYYLLIDGWAGDYCDFTMEASGFSEGLAGDLDSFAVTRGRVVIDETPDCLADSSETGLHHWLVEMTGNPPVFAMTNANGEYNLYSQEVGPHYLVLHRPYFGTPFWGACTDSVQVDIQSVPDTLEADFAVNKLVNCIKSMNQGSIWASGRRPCEPVTIDGYIDNWGNSPDSVVAFSVILDPVLVLDSASIPIVYQTGDTLNFELGLLNFGHSAGFRLYCRLPCDLSLLGHSFCNEIITYNPTSCDTVVGWSGASLTVKGGCNDTAQQAVFRIRNRGSAATTQPIPYVIIEDEVVLKDGFVPAGFQPGQVLQVGTAANGQTFAIQVGQEPNHPAHDLPTAFVESCIGPITQSLVNQLPHNDADPEIDIDCHTIGYSYDPNIKSAVPTGLTSMWHFIKPDEEIEYTIEFQNTGTDTAFSVIVCDTISPSLDLTTLRMMGASHDFDYEIYGSGILKVWFPNIKLVDSTTNELASKGYVRFRIGQKTGVELYTQILNRAAIYFDLNAPIITNETWHTIGYGFWLAEVSEVAEIGDRPLEINVLPNPFSESATIQISPAPVGWKVLRVFTPDGRTCRAVKFDDEKVELTRPGLPDGLLFFSIEKDGAVLAAGKLLPK